MAKTKNSISWRERSVSSSHGNMVSACDCKRSWGNDTWEADGWSHFAVFQVYESAKSTFSKKFVQLALS